MNETLSTKTVDRCAAGAGVVVALALGGTAVALLSGDPAPADPAPTSVTLVPSGVSTAPEPYLPRPRLAPTVAPRAPASTTPVHPSAQRLPTAQRRPARIVKPESPDQGAQPRNDGERVGRQVASRVWRRWGIPAAYCSGGC